jgi:hypothetical protein
VSDSGRHFAEDPLRLGSSISGELAGIRRCPALRHHLRDQQYIDLDEDLGHSMPSCRSQFLDSFQGKVPFHDL